MHEARVCVGDWLNSCTGIPRNMTGMATVMKSAGYVTHQIGKSVRLNAILWPGPSGMCTVQVGRWYGNAGPFPQRPRLRHQVGCLPHPLYTAQVFNVSACRLCSFGYFHHVSIVLRQLPKNQLT